MTGSRACARSMRSARAAGRDSTEALRVLRVRRAFGRRDCRTYSAYPPPRPLPPAVLGSFGAEPVQLTAHGLLQPALELKQQPQFLL